MLVRIVIFLCTANHALAVCDEDHSCAKASVQTLVLMQRPGNEPDGRDNPQDLPDDASVEFQQVWEPHDNGRDVSKDLPDDARIEFQQVRKETEVQQAAWQCHKYLAGQDGAWCEAAGVQDGWEYKFTQGGDGTCRTHEGTCWCCKREVRDKEHEDKINQHEDEINELTQAMDRLRVQRLASWESGRYVFMGLCKHGMLVEESKRTMDDQCGQCNPGYKLTDAVTDGSPPTCELFMGLCKHGMLAEEADRTMDDQCGQCEPAYQLTDAVTDGSPPTCEPRPTAGRICRCLSTTSYICTATVNPHRRCSSGEVCYQRSWSRVASLDEPAEICKVACQCTGHGNQFKCSDGHTAYCASGQECYRRSDEWWTKGAYDEACK